ncbi:MAG: patatin-like phospholipase family protein [Flavobacteriaceae bacterium]|nr:patatin-like phospholipase family protein [Flavobacteriaceae bacterium]
MFHFFKSSKKDRKSVSLVLSGGGARGLGHIGVLEVLEEYDFKIHSISGSSMGALVGCLYAQGHLADFKAWILQLNRFQVVKLLDFTLSRRGIIKGDRIFSKLNQLFPLGDLENLQIPVNVIATRLFANQTLCLDHGDAYQAIRASMSNPSIFAPIELENEVLVDGGIMDNIPIKYAKRHKKDLLIAVDVNAFLPYEFERPKLNKTTYFNVMNQTISLLIESNARQSIAKYPPDLFIQLSRKSCDIFDFFAAERQIAYGRSCAEMAINRFLKEA